MGHYLHSTILLLCIIFVGQSVNAQIGIRAKYLRNGLDNTQTTVIEQNGPIENPLSSGLGLGIDYWFRLKTKRVEFLPEIGFNFVKTTIDNISGESDINYNYKYFNFNIRVYPMDFEGDCDCPTFSNQSSLIKKGFYFELSPGLGYYSSQYNKASLFSTFGIVVPFAIENALSYKIGLGAGLDIGISNLLTINPYATYNYHLSRNYINVVGHVQFPIDSDNVETTMNQLELGLRFAIRLDSKNY